MKKDVELRTIKAISNIHRVKKKHIHLDSHLVDDLGMDSLDGIEIAMELEEVFNVEILDELMCTLHTVDDCVVAMKQLLENKS